MVNFKEIYHISRFQRGSNFFQGGGVQLFPGVSNCLFPIETHITCDFPEGVRKENECILLFLIQNGYERQTSIEILPVHFSSKLIQMFKIY